MRRSQSHSDLGGQNCPRTDPEVMTWTQGEENLILMCYIVLDLQCLTMFTILYSHNPPSPPTFFGFDFAESKVALGKVHTNLNFSSICIILFFFVTKCTFFEAREDDL